MAFTYHTTLYVNYNIECSIVKMTDVLRTQFSAAWSGKIILSSQLLVLN